MKAEMVARVNGQYGIWHDPHNNGTYSVTDSDSDSKLSLKRKTGDGKYTDKITFVFNDAGTSSCDVYGCSESQVTSYLDFSTNYCNLFSLYCGTADGCKVAEKDIAVEEKSVSPSSGASKSKSDCLKAVNARPAARKLFGGATRSEITEQVRDVVSQVKAEFEKQRSLATCPMCMMVETVPRFEPVQVMKQVVAGINYFVKVQIGDDAYAFLRIYDRFGSVSLTSIQLGKTEEDDIQYFE